MTRPPPTSRLVRPRIRAIRVLVAAVLTSLLAAAPALADDAETPVYAVQNRAFHMRHEFHIGVGVLPMNAFTKGVTVGGGYTFHFNQMWAWEIAQFSYSFAVNTSLREQLLQVSANPTSIQVASFFGNSSVVWTPIYGKLAITNRWVLHLEIFLTAGPAVGGFDYIDPRFVAANNTGTGPASVLFGFDAGGGFRFFVSDWFSLRLDVRDYAFFRSSGAQDELFLGLAGAFTFGGKPQ